jgi:hypothetical protein
MTSCSMRLYLFSLMAAEYWEAIIHSSKL